MNIEIIKSMLNQKGYYMFNKTYKNAKSKLILFDNNGYLYYTTFDNLSSNKTPCIVSRYNPFSIRNIHNYIQINHINTTLVSETFYNASSLLEFNCECGNAYYTKWKVFSKMGNYRCPICSKKQSKYANILEIFLKNNILYKKEVSFDDCYDVGKLYFDFAIYSIDRLICLIEVDGQFHFKDYYGQLAGQLKRDQIKNEYCQRKKIKLLRIPYWDVTNNKYIDYLERNLLSYYKYG